MSTPINVLILEDQPAWAELLLHTLRRAGFAPESQWVDTEAGYLAHLHPDLDVILADYYLPGFGALRALQLLRERDLDVPLIVVSGAIGEDVAIEALRQGAADYLLKDRLARMGPAVTRALERRRLNNESRRIQERLLESEARYRILAELTSDFAYALRPLPQGILACEWVSDAFTRVTGFTPDEVAERGGWISLIHPDDRSIAMRHHESLRAGRTGEVEFRIVTRSGQLRHLRDHGCAVRDARGLLIYGAAKDVTEWKEVGRALRQSEQRHRQIIETAHEAICVTDVNGGITFVNHRMAEMVGCAPVDLLGQPLLAFVDESSRATAAAHLAGHQQGAREQYDLRFRRRDGSIRWAIVSASPLLDADGRLAGTLAMLADITERKRAESELQQAQKLESVGRLAAGIAHEINTPIQFVGDNVHFLRESFAELERLRVTYRRLREAAETGSVETELLSEVRSAEEAADLDYLAHEIPSAIAQTLEGVERVATIVRAMKSFAHPDGNDKAMVDLNQGLLSTLTVARNELKYVADVETELDDLPPVLCRPGDINQVFLNLLVNAAHAIADAPGRNGRKGTVRVRTAREGDRVVVAISDTGCGIPEEIRPKIFDQFFTTKEVGRGTGQGLALARAIVVEQHGGSLTFESEVGQGTTFFVRLPIGGAASQATGQAA